MLTLAMTAAMAGCGNSGQEQNKESQAADTKTETSQAAKEETGKEESSEGTKELEACDISYVSWMTKGEDNVLLDGFMEENPQVKVEGRFLDGSSYSTVLMPMVLNGDIPDVFVVSPGMVEELAKEGFIRPLTGMPGVEEQKENLGGLIGDVTYDGQIYGYAMAGALGNDFVYYNKKFFEKNNLEIPKTQEEFEALCQQIKDLGEYPLLVAAGDTWTVEQLTRNQTYAQLAKMGDYGEEPAARLALLKGEAKPSDLYRPAFEKLEEYYQKDWISPGALSMGWESTVQYMIDGGGQMFVSGSWVPGSAPVTDNTNPDFELGAFPVPGIPDEKGMCHVDSSIGTILVLGAGSAHEEAANALFEYITRDDVLTNYLEQNGSTGLNVKVSVDPVLQSTYDTWTDSSKYVLESGMSGMPADWKPNFNQYMADVLSGASVDELLGKLDSDYETVCSNLDLNEYISALEK